MSKIEGQRASTRWSSIDDVRHRRAALHAGHRRRRPATTSSSPTSKLEAEPQLREQALERRAASCSRRSGTRDQTCAARSAADRAPRCRSSDRWIVVALDAVTPDVDRLAGATSSSARPRASSTSSSGTSSATGTSRWRRSAAERRRPSAAARCSPTCSRPRLRLLSTRSCRSSPRRSGSASATASPADEGGPHHRAITPPAMGKLEDRDAAEEQVDGPDGGRARHPQHPRRDRGGRPRPLRQSLRRYQWRPPVLGNGGARSSKRSARVRPLHVICEPGDAPSEQVASAVLDRAQVVVPLAGLVTSPPSETSWKSN